MHVFVDSSFRWNDKYEMDVNYEMDDNYEIAHYSQNVSNFNDQVLFGFSQGFLREPLGKFSYI